MHPSKSLQNSLLLLIAVLVMNMHATVGRARAQGATSLPGQFVYVDDDQNLFLVRGNVEEPLLLLQAGNDTTIRNPRFSLDGRYLAYCIDGSSTSNQPALYYLDTLTLERVKLAPEGSCSYDWSPDGRLLAFSTPYYIDVPSSVEAGIWSYARETGETTLLVQGEVREPRWLPDGQTLSYFDTCFECIGQFYTHNLKTGEIQEWSQKDSDWYIGPDVDWSPDGRSLAYDRAIWVYTGEGETYPLSLASSDGGTRKNIYSQPGRGAFFPIWSPDGKRIAFASLESFVIGNYTNRRGDLMAVSPDGSHPQKLYSSVFEVFPQAWSPDGRYLLFVEPQSMPDDPIEEQQLVLLDAETGSPLWKFSSNGGITADWAPLPSADALAPQASVPVAGKSGLLFTSPDFALAFYEPDSGQVRKLTASFTGKEISLSPDGRTILFGDQIVSIEGQADGTISATITATTNPGEFDRLNWSPDSQRYGYVEDGVIWLSDLTGSRAKLAEGDMPPDWSYDGRWMAYCDKEGRLWIAESGKPADWIVQQERCQVRWSPNQSILAYVTYPAFDFNDQDNGTAFLYDPISGSTTEVARSVSGLDWSPDGKLISIRRVTWMGASNYGFTLSAVNPETGTELLIEEFSAEMYGNQDWIEQTSGYIAGKYRFQADLLNKEQLAENFFDATRDGGHILAGSGDMQTMQIGCRDIETGNFYPLADMTLWSLPGVYARFSPDGEHILVSNDEYEKTVIWLARCSTDAAARFEASALPFQQYFSPDSRWLVMEETNATGEETSQIVLREIESGQVKEVQAGLNTSSTWFQMPEPPPAPPAPGSAGTSPTGSAAPADAISPLNLQNGVPAVDNRVMLLSILLWAGALIAIVVLMLYLWRQSATRPKRTKPSVPETPTKEKSEPIPAPAPGLTREEVGEAFKEGVQLVHAGKAEEGIIELGKVIAAEPGNNAAWFWLGIASARQKDDRSAERCFLQAKRHGHPEADKALAWLKEKRASK